MRNGWYAKFAEHGAKTGYAGNSAQDFLEIDPHLTRRKSLDFWEQFIDRIRAKFHRDKAKSFIFIGGVCAGRPEVVSTCTWRGDVVNRTDPCVDGMMNFPLCSAIREYLRPKADLFGDEKINVYKIAP